MLGSLKPDEIDRVLMTEAIGRIGCHKDGRTYVVPVVFAFDGERIIAHSGNGMKVQMMRANPEVCFQVEHVENLGSWQSVIVWGRYEELDHVEALSAMNLLMEKYRDQTMSETSMTAASGTKAPERAVVYAIRIKEKTGRYERR